MTEEKTTAKPRLWDSALRVVKGDNTMKLVEQFTAEMTLVAEGLVDDQARLKNELDSLQRSEERDAQRLQSSIDAIESTLRENQRDTDARLKVLSQRLDSVAAQVHAAEKSKEKHPKQGLIQQATILAAIVCGTWLLVTILNLLK